MGRRRGPPSVTRRVERPRGYARSPCPVPAPAGPWHIQGCLLRQPLAHTSAFGARPIIRPRLSDLSPWAPLRSARCRAFQPNRSTAEGRWAANLARGQTSPADNRGSTASPDKSVVASRTPTDHAARDAAGPPRLDDGQNAWLFWPMTAHALAKDSPFRPGRIRCMAGLQMGASLSARSASARSPALAWLPRPFICPGHPSRFNGVRR